MTWAWWFPEESREALLVEADIEARRSRNDQAVLYVETRAWWAWAREADLWPASFPSW